MLGVTPSLSRREGAKSHVETTVTAKCLCKALFKMAYMANISCPQSASFKTLTTAIPEYLF